MKKIITASAMALCFTLSSSGWTEERHDHAGQGEAPPSENVVKHEMRLLDKAFKNLIDSLLLNKPEAIEAPFHDVHRAKMATEKALHDGKVVLPKNNDKIEEFVELDEAFHDKLRKLLGAAKGGDSTEILKSAHEVLDGCVGCHTKFRE